MKKLIAFLIVAFYVVPLFAGMSSGMFVLPTGTNGQVLTYDDTQTNSVKFADASGGAQDLAGLDRQMLLEDPTWTLDLSLIELPSEASQGSWTFDGSGIDESTAFQAMIGTLTADTTSVSAAKARYTKAAGLSFSTGATYEITVATVTSAAADSRCVLGYLGDGTAEDYVYMAASTTSVIVYGAANIAVSIDTTVSHTYRLTVKDTTWKLFIDDVFRATGTVVTSGGADLVYFGDNNTGAGLNSSFTATGISYYTGGNADNYNQFRLQGDFFVGSTFLSGIDETINLTDDLDTGSAATDTCYNIELLSDGTLQFTLDETTAGRFVGGVVTDDTTATDFIPMDWNGLMCYVAGDKYEIYSNTLTTTEQTLDLRDFVPETATSISFYIAPTSNQIVFMSPVSGVTTNSPISVQNSGTERDCVTIPVPRNGIQYLYAGSSGSVAIRMYSYREDI